MFMNRWCCVLNNYKIFSFCFCFFVIVFTFVQRKSVVKWIVIKGVKNSRFIFVRISLTFFSNRRNLLSTIIVFGASLLNNGMTWFTRHIIMIVWLCWEIRIFCHQWEINLLVNGFQLFFRFFLSNLFWKEEIRKIHFVFFFFFTE